MLLQSQALCLLSRLENRGRAITESLLQTFLYIFDQNRVMWPHLLQERIKNRVPGKDELCCLESLRAIISHLMRDHLGKYLGVLSKEE